MNIDLSGTAGFYTSKRFPTDKPMDLIAPKDMAQESYSAMIYNPGKKSCGRSCQPARLVRILEVDIWKSLHLGICQDSVMLIAWR